jgi:hypothetical protein
MYKWNIPSIQRKRRIRRSISMRARSLYLYPPRIRVALRLAGLRWSLTRLHTGYANVKWAEVLKFTMGIRILKSRLLAVVAHTKYFTYKVWSGLNNTVRCSSHGFNNLPKKKFKKEDNGANWIRTWYVDQMRPWSTRWGDTNIRISTDEKSRISQQFTEPEGSLTCSQQPPLVVIHHRSEFS